MDNYKLSKFNYFVSKGSCTYIYKTLFDSFACFDYDPRTEKWRDADIVEMQKNKFIIPAECDEMSFLRKNATFSNNMSINAIVIAPSTACNARCFYCYEKSILAHSFDGEREQKVIDYIRSHSDNNKPLKIRWFGGEPLLSIDTICRITYELKKEFAIQASVVTNGSLINESVLKKLIDCNVTFIQLSVDGYGEMYDKRKQYVNSSFTFGKLLENIAVCLKTPIHVSVRLNFDRDNYNSIVDLINYIKSHYLGENLSMYPAQLFGSKCNMFSEFELEHKYAELIGLIDEVDMLPNKFKSFKGVHRIPCSAHSDTSVVIDPDGNLFHCEHDVGRSEYSIGNIDGISRDENLSPKTIPLQYPHDECDQCVFFPKCSGGCDATRRDGYSPCGFQKYLLIYHVDRLICEYEASI